LSQKINFEIDSGEIIDDPSQSEFATARLRLFSSGENRHGMYCEEEVLQSTAFTAYEKPVIFEVVGNDFGSHNQGKTIPAGFIVPNSAEFVRESDGRLALYAISKIWKRYSGKFVDIFINRNKTKSKLSVEMIMDESEEREDGLIGMKKFYYTAATILGDMLTEASPGANIEMLSFSKEYEDAYKKEFGYNKYSELDFRIPSHVKESAKMAIERYEKLGKGGSSVSLSLAKFILREEFSNPEKIRMMFKKLSSYSKKSLETDEDQIRFELWGGKSGYDWCRELFEKIEVIDNKRSAFFVNKDDNADFPEKEGKEETQVKKKEFESKEEEKAETPEQEKSESPEEQKKEVDEKTEMASPEIEEKESEKEEMAVEENKAEMSLDSYLDLVYTLSLMEEETESRKEFLKEEDEFALKCAVEEIKKEGEKDFAIVSKGMFAKMKEMSAKMAKMEAENKAYMSEFESLKSFKKSADEARFSYEIESTLKEVEAVMPSEEFEKARSEATNFSLETVDAWKNAVKAKAFTFSKPETKKNKEEQVAPRWAFNVNQIESKESVWTKK
jgi:hypothetical protein